MAIDDMKEDSVYSSHFVFLSSIVGEDTSSSKDQAWADSCLNTHENASTKNNIKPGINGDLNFRDYVASLGFGRGSDDDEHLIDDVIGDIENVDISDNNEENLAITNGKRVGERGKRHVKNVFRPNYTEDIVEDQINDMGMDLNSTVWELESSSVDIFKVWDLEISEEQDGFTLQIEKVFDDIPLIQPNPDDSLARDDEIHVSVDNLIAGMDDLSLETNLR